MIATPPVIVAPPDYLLWLISCLYRAVSVPQVTQTFTRQCVLLLKVQQRDMQLFSPFLSAATHSFAASASSHARRS